MVDLVFQSEFLNTNEADPSNDDEEAQVLATTIIARIKVSRQDHMDTRYPHCLLYDFANPNCLHQQVLTRNHYNIRVSMWPPYYRLCPMLV
jgi:hypothetical protein